MQASDLLSAEEHERNVVISPEDVAERPKKNSTRPDLPQCPPPSAQFVGRSSELERMRSFFFSENKDGSLDEKSLSARMFTVTGTEGCGKSQLCCRFVEAEVSQWQSLSSTRNVFFIDATTKKSIDTSLVAMHKAKGRGPRGESVKAAVRWLSSLSDSEEYFIYVDNLDHTTIDIHKYIPMDSTNIRVLISSRLASGSSGRVQRGSENLELPPLLPDEAKTLLVSSAKLSELKALEQKGEVAALVEELQYHPLSISRAGGFIHATGRRVRGYTEDFQAIHSKLVGGKNDRDSKETADRYETPSIVHTTVALSYREINMSCPRAAHFVGLLAFLHQDVPLEGIFERAFYQLQSYVPAFPLSPFQETDLANLRDLMKFFSTEDKWNSESFQKTLSSLCELSILERNDHGGHFMSQSTQTDILLHLDADETNEPGRHEATRGQAFFLVSAAITHTAWPDILPLIQLLPHVQALLPIDDDSIEVSQLHPDWCISLARPLVQAGFVARAEVYYRSAVVSYSQEDPESTASRMSLRKHAIMLQRMGRLAEAKDMLVELQDWSKRTESEDEDFSINVLSTLAGVLGQMRENHAAADMKEEVLRRRIQRFGQEDRSTLKARTALAVTWFHLGRKSDALQEQEQVYTTALQLFGEDDPDTVSTKKLYAGTLSRQCKYPLAESLHRQVVKWRKAFLGTYHPETTEAMMELVSTLSRQKSPAKRTEAVFFQEIVVESLQQRLGEDHLRTIRAKDSLAAIFGQSQSLEQKEEGLAIQVDNMTKYESQLDQDHPEVLTARVKLAETLHQLDRHVESQEEWKIVLARSQHIISSGQLDLTHTRDNMAKALSALGKCKQAVKVLEELVEDRGQNVGYPDHRTIGAVRRLAQNKRRLKKPEEAEKYGKMAFAMTKERWGDNHKFTKISQSWLKRAESETSSAVNASRDRYRHPNWPICS